MLYPDNRVYPLACGQYCFTTPGGPVARSNGTLIPGWTARGAANIKFADGTSELSLAVFPFDGWGTMSAPFRDPRGQTRNGGGPVARSDSLYTALLLASSASL